MREIHNAHDAENQRQANSEQRVGSAHDQGVGQMLGKLAQCEISTDFTLSRRPFGRTKTQAAPAKTRRCVVLRKQRSDFDDAISAF